MARQFGGVRWGSLDGLLEGSDGRFQIGQIPTVSVSVAQPDAQIVQIPRPTGGIRWGSLDCLPEGSDGRFQVGQVSPANVSVAQPITDYLTGQAGRGSQVG